MEAWANEDFAHALDVLRRLTFIPSLPVQKVKGLFIINPTYPITRGDAKVARQDPTIPLGDIVIALLHLKVAQPYFSLLS